MADAIFKTHRVAENDDIPRVRKLLCGAEAKEVMLQNVNTEGARSHFPLIDIAKGPYTWEIAGDFYILHGYDKVTGEKRSLRLRGICGVVQVCTYGLNDWYDFGGHGATRLMINETYST